MKLCKHEKSTLLLSQSVSQKYSRILNVTTVFTHSHLNTRINHWQHTCCPAYFMTEIVTSLFLYVKSAYGKVTLFRVVKVGSACPNARARGSRQNWKRTTIYNTMTHDYLQCYFQLTLLLRIVQFRIRHDRWIKTPTAHLYRVSLDLK